MAAGDLGTRDRVAVMLPNCWEFMALFAGATKLGKECLRTLALHVLPNVPSPVIVVAVFAVTNMIIREATLSFMGLGVEPKAVTWGRMLSGGRLYLSTAWWLTAFSGLAIFMTVLAVNLLGDYLRDWLDPRLRGMLGGGEG